MKRVIALREVNDTNLKKWHAGETLEVNDQLADLWLAAGWVKLAPSPAETKTPPANPPALSVTPPKAQSVPDGDVGPVTAPPKGTAAEVLAQVKRRYKRRDMRSEK